MDNLIANNLIASHSQLATFRRCPREHHHRYVDRVEAVGSAEPLEAGKRIHGALGAFHRGETSEPWDLLDKPLERALMRGYVARWSESSLNVTQTDVTFTISIGGIRMVGELDAIGDYEGARMIVEHKTSSEDISPGSAYWRRVTTSDAQVSTYLYASAQLGLGAERILYDVLRKSALRGKKGESDTELEVRALEDMIARPEHYFQRAEITRLADEHAAFERDIAGTVRLLLATVDNAEPAPRNPDSCQKFGRECDFYSVCFTGGSINDDSRFKQRLARKGDFTGGGVAAAGVDLRASGNGENHASGERAAGADYRLRPGSRPDERGADSGAELVVGEPQPDTQYQF